jgi:hypothetical protein
MTTILRSSFAVLALLLFSATGSSAQPAFGGGELTAGWAGWAGDDFRGLDSGLQLLGVLWFAPAERFDLGLDATLAFSDPGEAVSGDAEVTQLGVGARGRYALGDPDALHPFLDAQVGWTQMELSVGGRDISEAGLSFGPGIGLHVPIGRSVAVVVGADVQYHSYGGLQVPTAGIGTVGDRGSSGWRWGIRSGVLFGGGR